MYTKCIQFYYLEYYFKNYIMDYFERDVKDYFDVEVSEIEVEHNELYICSSERILTRKMQWNKEEETHFEVDLDTLGIYITAEDENDKEYEFFFPDEISLQKSGFITQYYALDINVSERFNSREEAENWANEEYNWLNKIEKKK